MKATPRTSKKQAFKFAHLLYRVAGFFILLMAISNIIFNVLSLMHVTYSYGYGLSSISYLFMYFHEAIANVSLRMSLVVIISFFFSSVFTFIATEINRLKLKYLIGAFIAYSIDFLFLILPFPYLLSAAELEFAFTMHISLLSLLFIIIIFQFILMHIENVKAGKTRIEWVNIYINYQWHIMNEYDKIIWLLEQTNMISRNQQQEYALYVIYSALVHRKAELDFAPDQSLSDLTEIDYYENDIFLRELVIKSLINLEHIIEEITPHLVKWKFDRLNMLSQAILIMSYAHYYYVEKIDKAIVINIAVKFAKRFVPGDDFKYINAILDRVIPNEWWIC